MESAPGNRVAPARPLALGRSVVALVLLGAFLVVVALGALRAVERIGDLRDRREQVLASRPDPSAIAGDVAESFRRFRSTLRPGERFALVFAPDVGRDQRGFYRLVALSYLYPALAAPDTASADAVMVFGQPSAALRSAFEEAGAVDGVWLGRRR
jgi:hypothetical protein